MALVAEYSFDAGDAVDNSGHGHDGTLHNTPTFPAGNTGDGLGLAAASSQYVEVADSADFSFGLAWTVMYWINPTSFAADASTVIKQNQWWFALLTGGFVSHGFYRSGGTVGPVFSNAAISSGVWSHIACRYNGADLQLVFDGVQDNTLNVGEFSMSDSAEAVRFGSWDGATEFLDAVLDDVRIFDEYLSDSQITTYMNTPVAGTTPTAATPRVLRSRLRW